MAARGICILCGLKDAGATYWDPGTNRQDIEDLGDEMSTAQFQGNSSPYSISDVSDAKEDIDLIMERIRERLEETSSGLEPQQW